MAYLTKISGWGNYPQQEAQLLNPSSTTSLNKVIRKEQTVIPRGMGRSYGDSANAPKVLQMLYCDHYIKFDPNSGLLTAEAGITLREILKMTVPKGWFLPVTPGTSHITLGGAIASDIHGKNHHIAGTFGQHITSLCMMLGTGEVVRVSPNEKADLFYATCGGMGLTGVIISASIQLFPIKSSFINQKTIKANCIEAVCEAFENNSSSIYRVAWIDCLSKGKSLGRSVLMLGEHSDNGGLKIDIKHPIAVPISAPSILLGSLTIKAFNTAYWLKAKHNHSDVIPLMRYFYPLDTIDAWNKLYGKAGFLQFQCVIPKEYSIVNLRKLLTEISTSGENSFLAVLKQFGKANDNLLSFPMEGYTLTLDFKVTSSAFRILRKLEDLVMAMGGRIYLSKDAVMKEYTFKSTYLNWEKFESVREKYGAIGKFSSSQSKRLGLA